MIALLFGVFWFCLYVLIYCRKIQERERERVIIEEYNFRLDTDSGQLFQSNNKSNFDACDITSS